MAKPYNQPNAKPVPKVKAVGVAGAVVTVIAFVLSQFGIVIPEEVSSAGITLILAGTTIVTFVAGYMRKDEK